MASSTASDARPVLKDLKEALSSTRKPDITHVRRAFLVYTCRPCEYGSVKYVRGNFLRPVSPGGYTGVPTPEDFWRFQSYLRAAASHIYEALDAMEYHLSIDPALSDVAGMKRAAYAEDIDVTPGAKVGPSLLPHVAPACSSLMMAIAQAVECGLLPADPGQPWASERAKQMLEAENIKHVNSTGRAAATCAANETSPSECAVLGTCTGHPTVLHPDGFGGSDFSDPVPGARW